MFGNKNGRTPGGDGRHKDAVLDLFRDDPDVVARVVRFENAAGRPFEGHFDLVDGNRNGPVVIGVIDENERGNIAVETAVGDITEIRLQRLQRAEPETGIFFVEKDRLPEKRDERPILVPPRISAARVGIGPAGHAGLVAVINRRRTGQRELHDNALPELPPHAKPLAIYSASDRVGEEFVRIDPNKVVAIVENEAYDEVTPFVEPDEVSKNIGERILDFIRFEESHGRLPKGLAYQSGVGKVANAVLCAMANDDRLGQIDLYTEVIQEAVLPLLKKGKLGVASGTALTLSHSAQKEFVENSAEWKKHFVLRQQEVSNSPDVIRRLGVISMNTALEVDIFGNVNSSLVCGSAMMNGIGGSADFARNCALGFFLTPSVAKGGAISSIVPYVSHVDHTDHDTQIFVTEQGLADLRGLPVEERARLIIKNCAHPDYRAELTDVLEFGLKHAKGIHLPLALSRAFEMHTRFLETGKML